MPLYSDELQEQLTRINSLQQQIEALRPLPADVQARIFQKFRLDWNYHSNSIEGNSLTYGETVAFIMEGVTAKGKPLKDHLDLRGHNQAIEVLLELIKQPEAELTERDIRELHSIIMAEPYEVTVETSAGPQRRTIEPGHYKTMPNHTLTSTGETHYYATPEETPARMHDLIAWYRSHRTTLHPLVVAAQFHHKFVAIHPFDDGNGRMTRLLTNLLLMKASYPPIVVKTEEKREYYAVLSQADAGVEEPLLEYFAERLIRSLEIYLKGARGEDISESDDLSKEIALLKASFNIEDIQRCKADKHIIRNIIQLSFIPTIKESLEYLQKIDEMFFDKKSKIIYTSTQSIKECNVPIKNITDFINWLGEKEEPIRPIVFGDKEPEYTYNNIPGLIRKLEYEYEWIEFKPIKNNQIDIAVSFTAEFSEYSYTISADEDVLKIKKYYPDLITQQEKDRLIKSIIQTSISTIKETSQNYK